MAEEITIEALRNNFTILDNFCDKLDNTQLQKKLTYLGLAEYLCNAGQLSENNYQIIKSYQPGGGSACLAFFTALFTKRNDLTIREFISKAVGVERNDVKDFLDQFPGDGLLKKLGLEEISRLACMLEPEVHGAKNWKYFASEYGYGKDALIGFENRKEPYGGTSATNFMLELLNCENPDLPLRILSDALAAIGQEKVAKLLDDILEPDEEEENAEIEPNGNDEQNIDRQEEMNGANGQPQEGNAAENDEPDEDEDEEDGILC